MNPIDPDKFYNATEILENQFFPRVESIRSVVNWIKRDMKGENLLKVQVYGEETGTRYIIKGENLIKFIAHFEDGSLTFEEKEK